MIPYTQEYLESVLKATPETTDEALAVFEEVADATLTIDTQSEHTTALKIDDGGFKMTVFVKPDEIIRGILYCAMMMKRTPY